jgi:hypothetical protein
MNERIQQLADEAAKFSAIMALPTGESGDNLFVEKLAELIVRDCALTAGLMEHEGRKNIGAQLLDNFEIEH